jgi:hypothetical protein
MAISDGLITEIKIMLPIPPLPPSELVLTILMPKTFRFGILSLYVTPANKVGNGEHPVFFKPSFYMKNNYLLTFVNILFIFINLKLFGYFYYK